MSIAASISPRYRETLYKEEGGEFDRFSTTKKHHTYSHRDILKQKNRNRSPLRPREREREREIRIPDSRRVSRNGERETEGFFSIFGKRGEEGEESAILMVAVIAGWRGGRRRRWKHLFYYFQCRRRRRSLVLPEFNRCRVSLSVSPLFFLFWYIRK